MTWLHYRAGPDALALLRSDGLTADNLTTLVGPASGPKWIVLAGIDQALLQSPLWLVEPQREAPRRLLVGASAGAWRMMALASRDPRAAHQQLLDGYINARFPEHATAPYISELYRRLLGEILNETEAQHIVDHPQFNVAAHVVRARCPLGWTTRYSKQAQLLSLGITGALQAASATGTDRMLQRVLFHSRPQHLSGGAFQGPVIGLTGSNLVPATVASGTVPLYMEPVRDPLGAPPGLYLDGGLGDYHLRQAYGDTRGITLFPHFQRRIVPIWFDRYWKRRQPDPQALRNVLQLYPSDDFVRRLPGGAIPTREDFRTHRHNPDERIRRWNEAARLSEALGQAFLDDWQAGRIPDLAQPL